MAAELLMEDCTEDETDDDRDELIDDDMALDETELMEDDIDEALLVMELDTDEVMDDVTEDDIDDIIDEETDEALDEELLELSAMTPVTKLSAMAEAAAAWSRRVFFMVKKRGETKSGTRVPENSRLCRASAFAGSKV